jgi:hypothetical protein
VFQIYKVRSFALGLLRGFEQSSEAVRGEEEGKKLGRGRRVNVKAR